MVTGWLPLAAVAPFQLPLAVQPVAYNEYHVSVVDPPIDTVVLAKFNTGTTTAKLAWTNP
jgi:hypothetical protein